MQKNDDKKTSSTQQNDNRTSFAQENMTKRRILDDKKVPF